MIVAIYVGKVMLDKHYKDVAYQEQLWHEALADCSDYLRSVKEGRWYLQVHPRMFEANNNCLSLAENWEAKVKAAYKTEKGIRYLEGRKEDVGLTGEDSGCVHIYPQTEKACIQNRSPMFYRQGQARRHIFKNGRLREE